MQTVLRNCVIDCFREANRNEALQQSITSHLIGLEPVIMGIRILEKNKKCLNNKSRSLSGFLFFQ